MMSANNDPLAQGGQPAKHYDEQEEFEYDDDNDEHDNDQSRQNNEDDEDEGEAERVQTSGTMLSGQQASMTTSGVASSDHVGRAVSLEERRKLRDVQAYADKINYSSRYSDDIWEYRHVTMPKELAKHVPSDRLMPEEEWRGLGVRQSLGWYDNCHLHDTRSLLTAKDTTQLSREHYLIHKPEPHVLLFRREKDYQIKYPNGKPPTNHGVLGKAGGLAH